MDWSQSPVFPPKRYVLHPLSILGQLLAFSLLSLFAGRTAYWAMLVLSLLEELLIVPRKLTRSLVVLASLYALTLLLQNYTLASGIARHWLGAIFAMLLIFLKLMPLGVLSDILSSHSSSELMHSFQVLGFPLKFCVAVAVFFRFVPDFALRLRDIRDGARTRHLHLSLLHPLRSFEIYIVPLMFKALSVGDTLGAAVYSKGIEYPVSKSSYREMRFTYRDGLALLSIIILLGAARWLP